MIVSYFVQAYEGDGHYWVILYPADIHEHEAVVIL
jgi:hypothetical protein